jgi:DNA-binding MarR family transcriptional regulator
VNEGTDPHLEGAVPSRLADQPSWLIGRAYARTSQLLTAGFEGRDDGLRRYHYRLLAALEELGPVSQTVLGRGTSVDRSDVVALLDALQQQGLITREPDPADRRRNVVSLTPAGSERLNELEAVIAGIQEQLLAPLSPRDQNQFLRLLRRVADG